jgi:hypothetical protein
VFLLAEIVLYSAARHTGLGSQFFQASTWARGDSGQYLAIADHGYTVFHCNNYYYAPADWCGDSGWLPLFPGLMEFVAHFGLPHAQGGADISAVFAAVMILLIWVLIGPEWSAKKFLALALAGVFPGEVYFFAIYPVSLVVSLSVAFLLVLAGRKYVMAVDVPPSGVVPGVHHFEVATG